MNTIIKRIFNIPADDKAEDAVIAAAQFGVTIRSAITTPRDFYGAVHSYTQVFKTSCGKKLVVSADANAIDAALCAGNFDWDESISNSAEDYRQMGLAAGLIGLEIDLEHKIDQAREMNETLTV